MSRLKLPCAGGVRVTPAGRSDTAYRLISSAQFFIRAPRLKERASVLREGTALGPRGPHVPWTGNADAFPLPASTSVLCPRAGGNLIQTRTTRLNDFLFQRSRAGRALSCLELASGRPGPTARGGQFAASAQSITIINRASTLHRDKKRGGHTARRVRKLRKRLKNPCQSPPYNPHLTNSIARRNR